MEHSSIFGFHFGFSDIKHDIVISEMELNYTNGLYYNKEYDMGVPDIGFWEINKENQYRIKEDLLLDLDNFSYIFVYNNIDIYEFFSFGFLAGVVANQYKIDKIVGLN